MDELGTARRNRISENFRARLPVAVGHFSSRLAPERAATAGQGAPRLRSTRSLNAAVIVSGKRRPAGFSAPTPGPCKANLGAMILGRTLTALGALYRRLAFGFGKAKAVTATARKLAVLIYRTLTDRLVYVDPGADTYNAHDRTRVVRRLKQRGEHLGFGLVHPSTGEVVEGAVS